MNAEPLPDLESLNRRAAVICRDAVRRAEEMEVRVSEVAGATLLDFGVGRMGTWSAALQLTRICLAGLGEVTLLSPADNSVLPCPRIQVVTDWPLLACIGSQYAGFPFSHGDEYAMVSGPGRLVRGREPILERYELTSDSVERVLVLESDRVPSEGAVAELLKQLPGKGPTWLCVAQTHSLPGTAQVVGRSVETAMHKLYELDFDLRRIRSAIGVAPVPPLGKDSLQSIGWTNDAILYGGQVQLWSDGDPASIADALNHLPSGQSPDFGRPFREIFESYDRDFYQIDRMLFSPARVIWHLPDAGQALVHGQPRHDLLVRSFGFESAE